MKKRNLLYIGPAGWSYKDWEGIVYPAASPKSFDRLSFLSQYFNTIEINSSFYRPPTEKVVSNWLRRVSDRPDFLFTAKLWQRFTHERGQFPGDEEIRLVKNGIELLKQENRLGALLIQFPWSFQKTSDNWDWLRRIIDLFRDFEPVVELRHNSWLEPEFFNYLKEENVGFANIDQPVIGASIPLTDYATSSVAYVRFHGRNEKNWFDSNADAASRYDYLYTLEELEDIRKKIETVIEVSPKTFLIFNNHFRGQGIANAFQLQYLFDGEKKALPADFLQYYPNLEKIAGQRKDRKGQISLFD
ncbi:hypothetical protein B6D60_00930 [candidate division KSB1 bacterium 4484_87]|nr:MAG: hypothetical protein B6D60_00930 [candidate division KSB1 bacterium 4484_87]